MPTRIWHSRDPAYIRSEWYSIFALDVSPMVISRALSVYAHRYQGSAFSLWWARLDLNQQCHTNPIYSRGWYQLHSTDPYIIIKMPVLKSLVIENYTSQRMPVWPNAKLGAAVLQLLGYGSMVRDLGFKPRSLLRRRIYSNQRN